MKEKCGQGGFQHVSKGMLHLFVCVFLHVLSFPLKSRFWPFGYTGLVTEEIVDDEANSVSASVKAVEYLEKTVEDSKNDSKDDESCWNAYVEDAVNRRTNAAKAERYVVFH